MQRSNWLSNRRSNFRRDKASGSGRLTWKLGLFRTQDVICCLHGVSYPESHARLYFNTKQRKNTKQTRVGPEIITVQYKDIYIFVALQPLSRLRQEYTHTQLALPYPLYGYVLRHNETTNLQQTQL